MALYSLTAIVLLGLEVDFDLSDVGKLLSPASQFDYKVAVLNGKLDIDIFKLYEKVSWAETWGFLEIWYFSNKILTVFFEY